MCDNSAFITLNHTSNASLYRAHGDPESPSLSITLTACCSSVFFCLMHLNCTSVFSCLLHLNCTSVFFCLMHLNRTSVLSCLLHLFLTASIGICYFYSRCTDLTTRTERAAAQPSSLSITLQACSLSYVQ